MASRSTIKLPEGKGVSENWRRIGALRANGRRRFFRAALCAIGNDRKVQFMDLISEPSEEAQTLPQATERRSCRSMNRCRQTTSLFSATPSSFCFSLAPGSCVRSWIAMNGYSRRTCRSGGFGGRHVGSLHRSHRSSLGNSASPAYRHTEGWSSLIPPCLELGAAIGWTACVNQRHSSSLENCGLLE